LRFGAFGMNCTTTVPGSGRSTCSPCSAAAASSSGVGSVALASLSFEKSSTIAPAQETYRRLTFGQLRRYACAVEDIGQLVRVRPPVAAVVATPPTKRPTKRIPGHHGLGSEPDDPWHQASLPSIQRIERSQFTFRRDVPGEYTHHALHQRAGQVERDAIDLRGLAADT